LREPASPDHDQRLKVLLKEFFEAFFQCFFPAWAARFAFTAIDWLDKELFLAPPDGEKRQLDLVARLHLWPGAPLPRTGATNLVGMVHVELAVITPVKPLNPAGEVNLMPPANRGEICSRGPAQPPPPGWNRQQGAALAVYNGEVVRQAGLCDKKRAGRPSRLSWHLRGWPGWLP
jgi:hypothetical protein